MKKPIEKHILEYRDAVKAKRCDLAALSMRERSIVKLLRRLRRRRAFNPDTITLMGASPKGLMMNNAISKKTTIKKAKNASASGRSHGGKYYCRLYADNIKALSQSLGRPISPAELRQLANDCMTNVGAVYVFTLVNASPESYGLKVYPFCGFSYLADANLKPRKR